MSGKLDLSSLPPEIRQKVEAGLAKLPPETRLQWETQGSPLLAKLVSGLAAKTASSRQPPPLPDTARTPGFQRPAAQPGRTASANVSPPREAPSPAWHIQRTPPWGHYNDTIAPGDRPGLLQRILLAAAIAGVAAWLYL
ncbi:MAG: hypothetical protein NT046_04950 [Arenimonas sp.]|nr:hypothetical protein [Arenimonas sp.]